MNIKSKNEVKQAVIKNVNRFAMVKETILKKNLKRDEGIISSEIFPRLRNTIALTHYFEGFEFFHFTLPLIHLDGYDLTQEEKENILNEYYHKESILWINNGYSGEVSKASLIKDVFSKTFDTEILFKSCEIDECANTVNFTLRLVKDLLKTKVKEEVSFLTAKLDEYLLPSFNFNVIADEINHCYETLSGGDLLAVYKGDLEHYHVLSLNVEEILKNSDFYHDIDVQDSTLKINISKYFNQSKLVKSLNRKLKKYGYALRYSTFSSKDDSFRSIGLSISVDASYPSKEVKNELVVPSETLYEVFDQKLVEYEESLVQKAKEQNNSLIQFVESGHFDEMIATQWVKATLMSTVKLTDTHFKLGRFDDKISFHFTVPFDRNITGLKELKRVHDRRESVGVCYMNMEDNILDALKKRFPFFEKSRLFGDAYMDFQTTEKKHPDESLRLISNELTFGFVCDQSTYLHFKFEILEWLASFYGVIDIEETLKEMNFNEKGISKKIDDYMNQLKEGGTSTKVPFEIFLGKIDFDALMKLYQGSSLYAKTSKELFENKHEEKFWSYYSLKEPYKQAKMKEFKSLKVANLFTQALLIHPLYKEMKETLKTFEYELQIEFKEEKKRKMETGNRSLYDNDIPDDVCEYSVQLVLR